MIVVDDSGPSELTRGSRKSAWIERGAIMIKRAREKQLG